MPKRVVAEWLRTPRVCSLELDKPDLFLKEIDVEQTVHKAADCHANAFRITALNCLGKVHYSSRFAPQAVEDELRDFVKEAQLACQARDLRLILELDGHGIHVDHPLSPEGARKSADGTLVPGRVPDSYETCLNGTYRDYFLRILGEVFSSYSPDACSLRGVRTRICTCVGCAARYQRAREKEIPPLDEETIGDAAEDYFAWIEESTHELRSEIRRQVKSYQKQAAIFYDDLPGLISAERDYDALRTSALGGEGDGPSRAGELANYCRNFPRPTLVQVSYATGKGTPGAQVARPTPELKSTLAQVLANGCYPDLVDFPLRDFRGLPCLAETFHIVERYSGIFDFLASEPEKFLLLPRSHPIGSSTLQRARKGLFARVPADDMPPSIEHEAQPSSMYASLTRLGLPVNLGNSGHYLSQLPGQALLCLSDEKMMSQREVEAVKNFVRAGGGLIATFETSLYDDKGRRRDNFGLGELFGADYESTSAPTAELPLGDVFLDEEETHPVSRPLPFRVVLPNPGPFLVCRRKGPGTALAHFKEQVSPVSAGTDSEEENERSPAIVVNTYGNGRVVYFPWKPEEVYEAQGYRDVGLLLREAVGWVSQEPIPIEIQSKGRVAATLYRQAKRYVVHLINLSYDPSRSVEAVYPLHEVEVQIRFKERLRITNQLAMVSKKAVRQPIEAREVNLLLPELKEFEGIIIEFD